MRIVNVTDQPAEYVVDSRHMVLEPHEVRDVEHHEGVLALRQGVIRDTTGGDVNGEGVVVSHRIMEAGDVDAAQMRKWLTYKCPLADIGQCSAKPFTDMEAFTEHMMAHSGPPAPPSPLNRLK